ncbi:MAG: hypothetical protein N4A48_06415 [Tepidibacter sp.]|uniref:hypothetical protein n=1 Tax=Tepidibacter sp. TaxID=2529387 RepID=UPI0025E39178|nr:hypothetical protein [Tepidibacter sp.]MCT4508384.1 hypothetical protein [Tepidibacter sp.]
MTTQKNKYLININQNKYIFYLDSNVLYVEIIKSDNKNNRKVLVDNIKDFSVAFDSLGVIHIVCIDFWGKLIHFINKKNSFKKEVVANLNTKLNEFEDMKLYVNKDILNILISNRVENKMYNLIHYSIRKNILKSYKICESNDKYISFKTECDKKGNIHLIYSLNNNDKNNIFYRMLNFEYNRWSIRERLSPRNIDVTHMSILYDTNDFINIIFSSKQKQDIRFSYYRKKINEHLISNWEELKISQEAKGYFSDQFLIQLDDYIKLFWKENNKFYFTSTKIGESSWSDVDLIQIKKEHNLNSIVYIGDEYNNYSILKMPFGYSVDKYKNYLIGVDEIIYEKTKINKNNYVKPYENINLESAASLEEISIKTSLKSYSEDIKVYFERKTEISELLEENKKEIKDEILDLHYEIKNLREKEMRMLKGFSEIRDSYSDLNKKINDLLDSSDIEVNFNKKNKPKIFEKIIDYFKKK